MIAEEPDLCRDLHASLEPEKQGVEVRDALICANGTAGCPGAMRGAPRPPRAARFSYAWLRWLSAHPVTVGRLTSAAGSAHAAAIREEDDMNGTGRKPLGLALCAGDVCARALATWPGLDRRKLTRTRGDPGRVARLIERRTALPREAILAMLEGGRPQG